MLYLKKEKAPQALKVIQKRLYVLTRQVQGLLIQMMNPEMTPDTARNWSCASFTASWKNCWAWETA